jgi:hypothetical protein
VLSLAGGIEKSRWVYEREWRFQRWHGQAVTHSGAPELEMRASDF